MLRLVVVWLKLDQIHFGGSLCVCPWFSLVYDVRAMSLGRGSRILVFTWSKLMMVTAVIWKFVIYLLQDGGQSQTSPHCLSGGRLYEAQLVTASDVEISWPHHETLQTEGRQWRGDWALVSVCCPRERWEWRVIAVFRLVAAPLYHARLCFWLTRYCWGDSPSLPSPPSGRRWRAGQRNDRKLEDVVIRLVSSAAPSCPSHHTPSLSSLDFVCIV